MNPQMRIVSSHIRRYVLRRYAAFTPTISRTMYEYYVHVCMCGDGWVGMT